MLIHNTNKYIQEQVTLLANSWLAKGYMFKLDDSSQGNIVRVNLQQNIDAETYVCIYAELDFVTSTESKENGINFHTQKIDIITEIRKNSFTVVETLSKETLYIIARQYAAKQNTYVATTTLEELKAIYKKKQSRNNGSDKMTKQINNVTQKTLRNLVAGKEGFGKKVLGSLMVERFIGRCEYIITNTKNGKDTYVSF